MKTTLKDFLKENKEITITPRESDERSPIKSKTSYEINYQFKLNGELKEIEGVLKPFDSGRGEDFEFEPEYFEDAETEEYFDNNWEDIEKDIIDEFNNGDF